MKKTVVLLLSLLMCISMLFVTACGSEDGDESKTSSNPTESSGEQNESASDASQVISEEEPSEEVFKYATDEFRGTTIKILTVSSDRHKYGELQFVPDDELVSNAINEAVKDRNAFIYDNYGISIVTRTEKYPSDVVSIDIQGNAADYDIVCESVDRMVTKISDQLFISLDEYFDFNDEWWDDRCVESLSLDGEKHFFVSGDFMLTDVDNIYLTLFNKSIYENNGAIQTNYGDIYKLVEDKKFTLDAFIAMSKEVSVADSDGLWSFNATFGNLSHSYGATIMVNGGGVATVVKSAEGGLRCAVVDEYSQNVFGKVHELMSNKQITQRAELIIGQGANPSTYGFAELEEMFVNGRGLFYNTTVGSISILRSSATERDFEFGVLPIPLYNEEQEEYCCAVNRYQSSVLGIPISSVENTEAAAFLINALGYYNTNLPKNVMSAYYEITLKLQGSDTDEDAEMLDIIFDSKFYDLGTIFTWGQLPGLYGTLINNAQENTLVSTYGTMEGGIQSAIEETYRIYIDSLV